MKGMLVVFTGMDGSGKTTHAKALVRYLRELGYRCVYTWAAHRPALSYLFLAPSLMLGYWRRGRKDEFSSPLVHAPEVLRQGVMGKLWRLLVFLDFQIRVLGFVRIPMLIGMIVVCDRYYYDILVGLRSAGLYKSDFGRCIVLTSPKPHITFLIDTTESVVSRRRGLSARLASETRKRYWHLNRSFHFCVLSGSEQFYETQWRIRSMVVALLTSPSARLSRNPP